MKEKYREREKKVELTSSDYWSQVSTLQDIYEELISPTCTLQCATEDLYWSSPGLQSIRLRDSCGHYHDGRGHRKKELTVKRQDRADNVDRYEVNLNVGSVVNAHELVSAIVGRPPSFTIHKDEMVFWGSNGLVVSIYQVNAERVFLEAEAPEVGLVDRALAELLPNFPGAVPEPRSLFEIYSET